MSNWLRTTQLRPARVGQGPRRHCFSCPTTSSLQVLQSTGSLAVDRRRSHCFCVHQSQRAVRLVRMCAWRPLRRLGHRNLHSENLTPVAKLARQRAHRARLEEGPTTTATTNPLSHRSVQENSFVNLIQGVGHAIILYPILLLQVDPYRTSTHQSLCCASRAPHGFA